MEETRKHAVEVEKEEDAPEEEGGQEAEVILLRGLLLERLISLFHLHHSVVMQPMGAWCNQVAQRAPVTRMISNGSAEGRGRSDHDE